MNYQNIRVLLDTQLNTVIGLPSRQSENTLVVLDGTEWCRSSLLAAEPNALTVGPNGTDEHQGLFQVDLFYPQNGGTVDVSNVAEDVMTAFKRGSIFTDGSVKVHVRMVWQQVAYQVDTWYAVPVVIRWVAYAA